MSDREAIVIECLFFLLCSSQSTPVNTLLLIKDSFHCVLPFHRTVGAMQLTNVRFHVLKIQTVQMEKAVLLTFHVTVTTRPRCLIFLHLLQRPHHPIRRLVPAQSRALNRILMLVRVWQRMKTRRAIITSAALLIIPF